MGYIVGLTLYVIVMIGIGTYVSKKNKTTEDYLVAGRSFGVFFNASTVSISFLGAIVFIGDTSMAFNNGIWDTENSWGLIATAGGGFMCLLLLGKFFIPFLWKLKYLSLGDFYYTRFGKTTGIIATVLICFTFIIWVATNVVVFGKIVTPLLGWNINTAIWVGIIILTIYTVMGGMYAVAYTDVFQLALMLLGLAVLVPMCLNQAGGLTEVLQSTPDTMKSILPQKGGSYAPWLAAWLILGLGSIASPDMAQRSFTAKTASIAKKSFYIAAAIFLIVEIAVILVGFSGRVLVEKGILDAALIAQDTEMLMPIMIKTLLPAPIAILFFGAVIASIMGASDSALMALAGMVSKNIYSDLFKPDASNKDMILVTRVSVVGMAIAAGIVATSYPKAVELGLYGFDLILACLFAPLALGLYFKKANEYGTIVAMLSGFLFRTFGAAFTNGFSFDGIVYPENWYIFTILSPIISLVALVAVSLLTQKQNAPLPLTTGDGTVLSV